MPSSIFRKGLTPSRPVRLSQSNPLSRPTSSPKVMNGQQIKSEGFSPGEFNLALEVGDQIAREIRLKVGKIGESVVAASAGFTIAQTGNGSLPSLSAFGGTNNLVSIDALVEPSWQSRN